MPQGVLVFSALSSALKVFDNTIHIKTSEKMMYTRGQKITSLEQEMTDMQIRFSYLLTQQSISTQIKH